MTIAEGLRSGAEALKASSIDSPEREAAVLMRHVLKCDAAFIVAHPEQRLNAVESILFKAVLKRRAAREPFQYISGMQEFYGLEFEVNRDGLIPRPETEILVEAAINEFPDHGGTKFCEIGVGSGCIAISILANLPTATAVAGDVSEAALRLAAKNAEKHLVADRMELVCSNVFENIVDHEFDMIVSNPPYVQDSVIETLQDEVRSFEPRVALEGGKDGLKVIRTIIEESPGYLIPGGVLLIEIGWDQSDRVRELLDPAAWQSVEFLPDLHGIPRILKGKLR